MKDGIRRKNTPKDWLINEIIEAEWKMFDKVQNQGGRAGCQDDEWTFYAMRYSQFTAFSIDVLNSYKQDLHNADKEGRNLLMEKYAYMMEFTDPAYFESFLKEALPQILPEKAELVDRIANILTGCERRFDKCYPGLCSRSRPLTGNDREDVSFHIYTIGELKTYSYRTLDLYYKYLQTLNLDDETENPSFKIHRATVEFYGYVSLEDAEEKIR